MGGDGSDKIYGGSGADTILGQKNGDKIYGNNGADKFKGGGGNDKLFCQNGDDVLGDSDTIKNFDSAQDTIEISAAFTNEQTAQQILDGTSTVTEGSIILGFEAGDQILLEEFTDSTAFVGAILIDF